jgi:membrane protein YdbS with pleckstrin-like domain
MDWLPLSPRARLLFYLQAFSRLVLFWIPTTAAAAFGASFLFGALNAAIGGVVWLFVLFLAALWVPSLAFDRWSYSLRDEDLLIARGVLVRAITAIPASRIQHVDVRQGPLEQWLGLARLQIHTASGVGGDGVIPGLTLEDAESLRDQLVKVSGDGGV